jgi:hypothetical protein
MLRDCFVCKAENNTALKAQHSLNLLCPAKELHGYISCSSAESMQRLFTGQSVDRSGLFNDTTSTSDYTVSSGENMSI